MSFTRCFSWTFPEDGDRQRASAFMRLKAMYAFFAYQADAKWADKFSSFDPEASRSLESAYRADRDFAMFVLSRVDDKTGYESLAYARIITMTLADEEELKHIYRLMVAGEVEDETVKD